MNNEEIDIYIKGKIKDGHIPERIDNLFNNSAKIIENKGEKRMEENLNMNQNQEPNNQNKPEKKKMPVALKRVLATAACLTLLLGGGNIYASTQGYDNIFFLIAEKLGIATDVFGKENILSDRDITISYRPIEISKGTQIQVNSLVIKNNEAKLKIQVDESNATEPITPLKYIVKDENGTELCNYTSSQSQTKNEYKEELILKNYKEETKILELEILKKDDTSIVKLEIDLENKKINVIGNAEEVTKISEEELKQYLGAFAILSYENKENLNEYLDLTERRILTALQIAKIKNIDLYTDKTAEYNNFMLNREKTNKIVESFTKIELNEDGIMLFEDIDKPAYAWVKERNNERKYFVSKSVVGFEPTCLEVTDIAYVGGIYNVAFKFCYSTEANKGFESDTTIEDLPVYEMSMGLILNEDNEYSKYKISTMSEATLVVDEDEKQDKEEKKSILNFDLSFLKLENQKANKIYSPLSIKYALKMLEEGTSGDSKLQISNLIENYTPTKYKSNSNMSLANGLFVRNTFNDSIKQKYINTLRTKYNAEIIVDDFSSAKNINSWVSNKTLNLIKNMIDSINQDSNFFLINALGIDMQWENKFLGLVREGISYEHQNFYWTGPEQVTSHEFDNKKQTVSGMEIVASINNYDIVKELGEENIKKTVGDEFRKWAKSLTKNDYEYKDIFHGDLEKKLKQYLDGGKYYGDFDSEGYIKEINSNYGRVDYSTDFSLYVDENIKAFSKDLKEYDGTTLQYIGIMPTTQDLNNYVENIDETKINNIISNLKELKKENFNNRVVTKITGYIPKFKFEYELNLKQDLQQIGITNVFEQGKANLTEICDDEEVYIEKAVHKANIEFTQDGIKAAAATMLGGAGAGGSFDYIYDIPVEEIDLTFDKPYMFLIRDKETGEIWFMGTVYEPLSWEEEPENR